MMHRQQLQHPPCVKQAVLPRDAIIEFPVILTHRNILLDQCAWNSTRTSFAYYFLMRISSIKADTLDNCSQTVFAQLFLLKNIQHSSVKSSRHTCQSYLQKKFLTWKKQTCLDVGGLAFEAKENINCCRHTKEEPSGHTWEVDAQASDCSYLSAELFRSSSPPPFSLLSSRPSILPRGARKFLWRQQNCKTLFCASSARRKIGQLI